MLAVPTNSSVTLGRGMGGSGAPHLVATATAGLSAAEIPSYVTRKRMWYHVAGRRSMTRTPPTPSTASRATYALPSLRFAGNVLTSPGMGHRSQSLFCEPVALAATRKRCNCTRAGCHPGPSFISTWKAAPPRVTACLSSSPRQPSIPGQPSITSRVEALMMVGASGSLRYGPVGRCRPGGSRSALLLQDNPG